MQILKEAEEMTQQALSWLLQEKEGEAAVTVLNSLSFPRQAMVSLPETFCHGAVTEDGKRLPVQYTDGVLKTLVSLPAGGAVVLSAAAEEKGEPQNGICGSREGDREHRKNGVREGSLISPALLRQTENGWQMENEWLAAVINHRGEVVSFVLKESGRELAAGPMNRLRIFKDVPRHFDAWDIDASYREMELEGARDIRLNKVSEGLEAVLRITGKIGSSSYTQDIRLEAGQKRLEFHTRIDWQELHRLLKAAFPVRVHAENARHEIQFGFVERPAHRSRTYDKDRFEVCNHRYTALCDEGHGAAVLNDGKYGISVEDGCMELTLLRAAASPQMRTDNGIQEFTYAYYAWEGSFREGEAVRQGYELNVRPVVRPGRPAGQDGPMSFGIGKKNILLDTMKPAEDGSGDMILRMYEAERAAVVTQVYLPKEFGRAYLCDMLEQELEEIPIKDRAVTLDFRAFEVKTVRLI